MGIAMKLSVFTIRGQVVFQVLRRMEPYFFIYFFCDSSVRIIHFADFIADRQQENCLSHKDGYRRNFQAFTGCLNIEVGKVPVPNVTGNTLAGRVSTVTIEWLPQQGQTEGL
jgi:hypothetical protein